MTFRDTLAKHTDAVRRRDLAALADTLPPPGDPQAGTPPIVLVTAEGKVIRSVETFLSMHRDWFGSTTWTLDFEPVETFESADLGVAVFRLAYRDTTGAVPQASVLTLVFQRRGGKWVMVQDQNTPAKEPARAPTE
jgi:ketosteroid isomerase-like protein